MADKPTPLAKWKRLDMVQDVLPDADRKAAEAEGIMALAQYEEEVSRGDV